MTVEELMELKRKADAIAEIEKTVVKEANRYNLLLENLKQILKFFKDTLINTDVGRSIRFFLTEERDRYTYVGIHENGEFYIDLPGCSAIEINESNFIKAVTYKNETGRFIRRDFVLLADNWVRIKEDFLQGIKEEFSERIKCSQKNIASMTEDYITAKEFQV